MTANKRIEAQFAIVTKEQRKLLDMLAEIGTRKSNPAFQKARALFAEGFRLYGVEETDAFASPGDMTWDYSALILNGVLLVPNKEGRTCQSKLPELKDPEVQEYLEDLSEEESGEIQEMSLRDLKKPKPLTQEERELEAWYAKHYDEEYYDEEYESSGIRNYILDENFYEQDRPMDFEREEVFA